MNYQSIKNLRYSNQLSKIIIGMSVSYCTIYFITALPTLNAKPSQITLTNRDNTFKKFRSLKTLHCFLNEVLLWEIHPDLKHLDQLSIKPELYVL